ncbi:SCP2 sterol-binding domain-containing protein [Streptomyces sp. NPDC057474]|uniref:SCP2 sterol-binding domain-containing protein n=1 Tax=Streptomyces sp. NPDC057474 TaxID=3346144 RepID=UPI003698DD34
MAVDIQDFFNSHLPEVFATKAEEMKAWGVRYQISITGEGGGDWFVDASSSGPKVIPGVGDNPDVTIVIAAEDFRAMHADPKAGVQLFFTGQLKITGDQMKAMRFPELVKL